MLLGALGAAAATVPLQEGFEGYPDGTTLNTLSNQGWEASSDAVVIKTVTTEADAVLGTNAVVIPEGLTAAQTVTSEVLSNVWVELYAQTNMGMSEAWVGSEAVDSNMTVQVFLETNGCPVVWNPDSNAWGVCTQDTWLNDVATFSTSQWARLTFCQNYSNKTASLFLNGHLMVTGLRFIDTNRTSYGRFEMVGGLNCTSTFDQVSASYTPPANMADVDDDGMPEAQEIQLYGDTTTRQWRTVTVITPTNGTVTPLAPFTVRPGGQTNFQMMADAGCYVADVRTNGQTVGIFPGQYTDNSTYLWADMLPDGLTDGTFEAVFLRKPQLTAAVSHIGGPSATGGAITLSVSEVFPGGQVICAMTGETSYVVSSILTNGAVAATFGGASRILGYTLTNIWGDLTVTAVFRYSANLTVTNDYPTIQEAVAAAQAGTTIAIGSGTYTNDVDLDKSVTLRGTNVTLLGALGLQGGVTGTLAYCEGFVVTGGTTVASGALLVVSNGNVEVGSLVIEDGATVRVVNATAFVVDGVAYTGTFILGSEWGTVAPQTPPYSDPFERYAVGTKLNGMGYFGWDASSPGVVVQNAVAQSNRAVEVPAAADLSSAMGAAGSSNVWLEFYYQDTNRTPSEQAFAEDVDTNVAVEAFINTNGFVTVFNPSLGQWDICSNDAQGVSVTALARGAWLRLTFNQNYARGRAAVFMNGRLLRQDLRFINTNLVNSGRFELEGGYAGPTYLDTYSVRTNWAGIVSDDSDGDGWWDAREIDQFGNLLQRPAGAIYRMR